MRKLLFLSNQDEIIWPQNGTHNGFAWKSHQGLNLKFDWVILFAVCFIVTNKVKQLWISKTVTRILDQFDSQNFGCRTSQILTKFCWIPAPIKTSRSRINIRPISNICLSTICGKYMRYYILVSLYSWITSDKKRSSFRSTFFRKITARNIWHVEMLVLRNVSFSRNLTSALPFSHIHFLGSPRYWSHVFLPNAWQK